MPTLLKLNQITPFTLPTLFSAYAIQDLKQQTDFFHDCKYLSKLHDVKIIVGCSTTAAESWFAARYCFPDAVNYLISPQQTWLNVDTSEYLNLTPCYDIEETTETVVINDKILTPLSTAEPATNTHIARVSTPNAVKTLKQMGFDELKRLIFQKSSWGPENKNYVQTLLDEIDKRSDIAPHEKKEALRQKRLGEQAHQTWQEYDAYLKHNPKDQAWFEEKTKEIASSRIRNFLEYQYKKHCEHIDTKRNTIKQACLIKPVTLINGHHPNSLRHLNPQQEWTILIDETGQHFSQTEIEASNDSKHIGRLVALILPNKGDKLPALKKGFHANNESSSVVDAVLNTLLQGKVGVFGISILDHSIGEYPSWFNGIYQLIRWTLRLLPLNQAKTKIYFKIEQRNTFTDAISLDSIAEILTSELKKLDFERFKDIYIHLAFTKKAEHPANGYVDALAFTWGSPSKESKKRLKESQLLDHCFLNTSSSNIERLYQALNHTELSPADWYRMVSEVEQEPKHSLLRSQTAILGKAVQGNSLLWQKYMYYVQAQLQQKTYQLPALQAAITWLNSHQSPHQTMPKLLKLMWLSHQLASKNHAGAIDFTLFSQAIDLGEKLLEESAREVCEIQLRMAVAATNAFEFSTAQELLARWKDRDIHICGTKNKAKVLSSLGQHAAFTHQTQLALDYFNQAISLFKKLSNQEEAKRDIQQTQLYQLIVLCDDSAAGPLFKQTLQSYYGNLATLTKKLARTSVHEQRFLHHVLLRGLMLHRAEFKAEIAIYLQHQQEWIKDETQHPWPLINIYRAWLLQEQGQTEEANLYAAEAIQSCEADTQASTLYYMGQIIRVTSRGLGLQIAAPNPKTISQLKTTLPQATYPIFDAPDTARSIGEVIDLLKTHLPFNFH